MAILFNKAPSPTDNITYLIQQASQGKEKTKEEMEALRDEMNRQYKLLGVKTKAVYFPKSNEFRREGLDPTDNMVLVGAPDKQVAFLKKLLPKLDGRYGGWSGGPNNLGLAQKGEQVSDRFYPGQFGVIDSETAAPNIAGLSSGVINPTQMTAYGAIHEDGHAWIPSEGHYINGVMESGDVSIENIKNKMSIDQLLNPTREGNISYRDIIINRRQHGKDKDAVEAKDNYIENLAKFESEEKRKALHATANIIKRPSKTLKPAITSNI